MNETLETILTDTIEAYNKYSSYIYEFGGKPTKKGFINFYEDSLKDVPAIEL